MEEGINPAFACDKHEVPRATALGTNPQGGRSQDYSLVTKRLLPVTPWNICQKRPQRLKSSMNSSNPVVYAIFLSLISPQGIASLPHNYLHYLQVIIFPGVLVHPI